MSDKPLPPSISPELARSRGMEPITDGYCADQLWMAENALAGLRAGGIDCALVQHGERYEVWRRIRQQKEQFKSAKDYGYNCLRAK